MWGGKMRKCEDEELWRWEDVLQTPTIGRTLRSDALGKKLTGTEHFWTLRCRKSARRSGAKHISKSTCTKHTMYGPLLDVQMSFRVAGARDCAPCQTWAKREGFVAFPKTMAGVGHLKRICKDAFSVAGAVQKTCSWEMLGGQGADFLRGVAIWICRFAKMILRDRCSTSYDLASIFRGRRSTLDRWNGKIAKFIGTRPSALHSTFHFWRKSRRILSFLMLSTSKNEEVSQNCFVFDVVKFKTWGSLVELLRLWHCQVQNLRKSGRKWGSLAELLRFWRCQVQNLRKSGRKWGSLAELLRFWRCQVQNLRKSRRIDSFLMLST